MKKHKANKAQEEAFKQVVKAINRAKSKGLVFYGKQYSLVAYTRQANNYIENEVGFIESLGTGFSHVPYLGNECLHDSGADDFGDYKNLEDEEKYGI